jgi:hypothetical protein
MMKSGDCPMMNTSGQQMMDKSKCGQMMKKQCGSSKHTECYGKSESSSNTGYYQCKEEDPQCKMMKHSDAGTDSGHEMM